MKKVDRNMIIDRVDDQDRVIGQIRRAEVFKERANFRVVHILIYNKKGELLLQQLSPSRERHPGQWGSSVAGYVFRGEDYRKASRRRLRQELGIARAPLHLLGKFSMRDKGCRKFVSVFTTEYDGPLRPDPDHISQIQFVPVATIKQELKREEHMDFTPTFSFLFGKVLEQGER
jgi:isopentenyldiphosphate isomerase